MAIALHPRFPVPDRVKQPVRLTKDEDGARALRPQGGLEPGRPYRRHRDGLTAIGYRRPLLPWRAVETR